MGLSPLRCCRAKSCAALVHAAAQETGHLLAGAFQKLLVPNTGCLGTVLPSAIRRAKSVPWSTGVDLTSRAPMTRDGTGGGRAAALKEHTGTAINVGGLEASFWSARLVPGAPMSNTPDMRR